MTNAPRSYLALSQNGSASSPLKLIASGENVQPTSPLALIVSERIAELLVLWSEGSIRADEQVELRRIIRDLMARARPAEHQSLVRMAAHFLGSEAERLGISLELLRVLVRTENHLHRLRLIPTLSALNRFVEVLDHCPKIVQALLFSLPEAERHYRTACGQGAYSPDLPSSLCRRVKRQVRSIGAKSTLQSDEALAEVEEIPAIIVFQFLQNGCTQQVQLRRRSELYRRGVVEEHLLSPAAFVRAELAAIDSGFVFELAASDAIAREFKVSAAIVDNFLSDSTFGLKAEERRRRQAYLALEALGKAELRSPRFEELFMRASEVRLRGRAGLHLQLPKERKSMKRRAA